MRKKKNNIAIIMQKFQPWTSMRGRKILSLCPPFFQTLWKKEEKKEEICVLFLSAYVSNLSANRTLHRRSSETWKKKSLSLYSR